MKSHNILLENSSWVAAHEMTWLDFMAACEEAIALAEPLSDDDRRFMRDALEAEAALLVADRDQRRNKVC